MYKPNPVVLHKYLSIHQNRAVVPDNSVHSSNLWCALHDAQSLG